MEFNKIKISLKIEAFYHLTLNSCQSKNTGSKSIIFVAKIGLDSSLQDRNDLNLRNTR